MIIWSTASVSLPQIGFWCGGGHLLRKGGGGGGLGKPKKKLKLPLLFKQSKEVLPLPLPSPSACEDWGEKQHN